MAVQRPERLGPDDCIRTRRGLVNDVGPACVSAMASTGPTRASPLLSSRSQRRRAETIDECPVADAILLSSAFPPRFRVPRKDRGRDTRTNRCLCRTSSVRGRWPATTRRLRPTGPADAALNAAVYHQISSLFWIALVRMPISLPSRTLFPVVFLTVPSFTPIKVAVSYCHRGAPPPGMIIPTLGQPTSFALFLLMLPCSFHPALCPVLLHSAVAICSSIGTRAVDSTILRALHPVVARHTDHTTTLVGITSLAMH